MFFKVPWSASQINWKNVLGGLGGIELHPNTNFRSSKSLCDPLKPVHFEKVDWAKLVKWIKGKWKINWKSKLRVFQITNFKRKLE